DDREQTLLAQVRLVQLDLERGARESSDEPRRRREHPVQVVEARAAVELLESPRDPERQADDRVVREARLCGARRALHRVTVRARHERARRATVREPARATRATRA